MSNFLKKIHLGLHAIPNTKECIHQAMLLPFKSKRQL